MMNKTICVYGTLSNRPVKIEIVNPQLDDIDYVENVFRVWNQSNQVKLRGNMEIKVDEPEIHSQIVESNVTELMFFKITEPSPNDIKYILMLVANWNNYYKPENYLLPNTIVVRC